MTDIQRHWIMANMAHDLQQTLKYSGHAKKSDKEFGLDENEYNEFRKKIRRQLREQPDTGAIADA